MVRPQIPHNLAETCDGDQRHKRWILRRGGGIEALDYVPREAFLEGTSWRCDVAAGPATDPVQVLKAE
jgi:hypothetical protein